MTSNFLKFVFIFSTFFTLQGAGAENPNDKIYKRLARSDFRPTMKQVHRAFKGNFPRIRSADKDAVDRQWRKFIYESLPMTIAKMELIYPGATWATLGRDAVSIADLLEAFYMGLGEASGRVVRINASTETFNYDKYPSPAARDDLFLKMLAEQGLRLTDTKMRPFIFIDRTSYSRHSHVSQSTQLIDMIYERFMKTTGLPAETLFKKLSIVTSQSSDRSTDVTDPKVFFKNLKRSSDSLNYPNLILYVPELAVFTDREEWHDSFGPIVKYPNGRLGGELGKQKIEEDKIKVIKAMINGYNIVTSLNFQKAVRDAAKKLGYDFDIHMKSYGKGWIPTVSSEIPIDIDEVVQTLVENYFSNWWVTSRPELDSFVNEVINSYTNRILALYVNSEDFYKKSVADQNSILKAEVSGAMVEVEQRLQSLQVKGVSKEMAELEVLFSGYLKNFGGYEEGYNGKSYLSSNAQRIQSTFSDINKLATYSAAFNVSYIKLLDAPLESGMISTKDYRRLVLYALSQVIDEEGFYERLSDLMAQSPYLKPMLIKYAEVFMTSDRYGTVAQKKYKKLLDLNLLPMPPKEKCEEWLKVKSAS